MSAQTLGESFTNSSKGRVVKMRKCCSKEAKVLDGIGEVPMYQSIPTAGSSPGFIFVNVCSPGAHFY